MNKTKNSNIVKIPCGKGYYLFKLMDVLESAGMTRYYVSRKNELEYMVVNRLATGNTSKLDLGVISKICDYCNCTLNDIIEYVPNSK